MIFDVYSIRDVKSGYSLPITEMNDAVAMRNFANAVNKEGSIYNTHAKDFSLYRIGNFDSENGILEDDIPQLVCEAYSLLEEKE
uniref:Nonstructural protein n=2 Tax=unclassified Microvirus TaxID=338099 RepID=A0AAU8AW41_9VIRU